jgi:hypothetical protein
MMIMPLDCNGIYQICRCAQCTSILKHENKGLHYQQLLQ